MSIKKKLLSSVFLSVLTVCSVGFASGCSEIDSAYNLDQINTESVMTESNISFADFKVTGITGFKGVAMSYSANSKKGEVTLTATISPSNVSDKAVDWSVQFVNPSDSWAVGKTASDYVSVTPTADGALTAKVKMNALFGSQIRIVCASRSDSSKYGTCTVDCGRRLNSIGFITSSPYDELYHYNSNSVGNIASISASNVYTFKNTKLTYSPTWNDTFTTSSNSVGYKISVKATTAFYNALKNQGLGASSGAVPILISNYNGESTDFTGTVYDVFVALAGSNVEANAQKFNTAVQATTGEYDFELIVDVSTTYETVTYSFPVKIIRSTANITATSLTLSTANIIF